MLEALIVREDVLLHFVDPICRLASQTLVVFLHPADELLEFFGLPRSHIVGSSLKQARTGGGRRGGDAVMVPR